jgi:hypothetical protein
MPLSALARTSGALHALVFYQCSSDVVTDQEFPSEEQRAAIVHIACVATLEEPHVIVEFEAGTSPFDVLVPASAKIYVDPYG